MDDANLSKLSLSPTGFTPNFQKDITEYHATVSSDTDKVEIQATTSDRGASYVIKFAEKDGQKCTLKDGMNKIVIEVSSEDGTIKNYVINCKKLSASDAVLKSLKITDLSLEPVFQSEVYDYKSSLKYDICNVKVDTEVEDAKCEVVIIYNGVESIKNKDTPVNIELNSGNSKIEISVKSPNRQKNQVYTLIVKKELIKKCLKFKNIDESLAYEDPVSLAPYYCPISFVGHENTYSQPFIEFFFNQNRQDFLSGNPVNSSDPSALMIHRFDVEKSIAKCEVCIPQLNGESSTVKKLSEIGSIVLDTNKQDQIVEKSKVKLVLDHDASLSDNFEKFETRKWEKDLCKIYDETDPKILLENSEAHEKTYLKLINEHNPRKVYESGSSPIDALNLSIYTCATAIKFNNKDHELHFRLAMLLEEKNFVEDIYGLKSEDDSNDFAAFDLNKCAKNSSKEEEINAICKLRNVEENAQVEKKLKALDEEYHHLLQSGQSHKADQVQNLYLFKVQQTKMDASTSTKVTNNQTALGQSFLKYQDALYLSETTKITKYLYHFHMGRMYCIRSNTALAIKHFTICLQWTSDDYKNLVKFYLGYALSLDKEAIKTRYEEAVFYMCIGLQSFLEKLTNANATDTQPKLYAQNLFTILNTSFLQAFINIGSIVSSNIISSFGCIISKDSFHYCAWLCSQALTEIHKRTESNKKIIHSSEIIKQVNWLLVKAHKSLIDIMSSSSAALNKPITKKLIEKRCFYLSALLKNINKDNNLEVLNLQEKICQRLVQLNPCDNYFLYLLANAQFEKYDTLTIFGPEEQHKHVLEDCRNSIQASIDLEEKPTSGEPLKLISDQKWWTEIQNEKIQERPPSVKSVEAKPAQAAASTPNANDKAKAVPTKKSDVKVPAGKPAVAPKAAALKPVAPPAKAPPAAKGATAAKASAAAPKPATIGPECKHNEKKDEPKKESVPEQPRPASVKVQPKEEEKPKPEVVKINPKISGTRIVLARVYTKLKDIENAKKMYNQVLELEPNNHDAYVELAEMLKMNNDLMGAVDVYTRFKTDFTKLSFDDAFIFGEIVSILMKQEKYDDPRLVKYTVLWGKVMGTAVLDKYIKKLDEKNKTKICREIYCGIHMKDINDPELQNFFKFKGWL